MHSLYKDKRRYIITNNYYFNMFFGFPKLKNLYNNVFIEMVDPIYF